MQFTNSLAKTDLAEIQTRTVRLRSELQTYQRELAIARRRGKATWEARCLRRIAALTDLITQNESRAIAIFTKLHS